MNPIYLDHCSTTKIDREIRLAMEPFLDKNFGNSFSLQHEIGQKAAESLAEFRRDAAVALGVSEARLVLTSGATEANNLVVLGFAARYRSRKHSIFVSAIEHRCIMESARLADTLFGSEVHTIPVDTYGMADLDFLRKALATRKSGPVLVCVMHTNNEVPVRQEVEEIARMCRKSEAFFHCDAVQSLQREDFSLTTLGATSAVVSSHKVYGPKGCGLLLLASSEVATPFEPLAVGGGQEGGLRSGTVNVASAVGGLKAVSEMKRRRVEHLGHLQACTKVFKDRLQQKVPGCHLVADSPHSVPGIVSFWIESVDAETLLRECPSICISRGATCSTGGEKFSHVPTALGLPVDQAANVLRASFGWQSSVEDCASASDAIAECVLTRR